MRIDTTLIAIAIGIGIGGVAAKVGIMEDMERWKDSPYANYPTQFTGDIIPVCFGQRNSWWWWWLIGGILDWTERDTLAQ
jgi:hypothetical protein